MFPPDECSRAEGNGALGRFSGWDILVLCGMGPLTGTVTRGCRRDPFRTILAFQCI